MKRKATISLLTLFFFLFALQLNADIIGYNPATIAPPSNDDCANAITLTVNTNFLCTNKTAGTLLDATGTSGLSGCPGLPQNANDDVWYKFVATDTSHKVELLNIAGSETDLYFMVFDGGPAGGDCATKTAILCGSTNPSTVSSLTVGNTYFIAVFTNSSTPGADTTFDICVGTTPTAPANDECSSALAITSLPFNNSFDASAATNNGGSITAAGCIDMNDGVWYTVTGDSGNITVTVAPDAWDAAIAVYEGSCGSLTCVSDSNVGVSGFTEATTFASTLNTIYYVNVAFPGSSDQPEGAFNLSVTSDVLSIDDIVAKGFSYYPNPVENILKMHANEAINLVSIYSVLGKEIKRLTQTTDIKAEIDMSNLPAGTYFVKVLVGNTSGSFKVLKN